MKALRFVACLALAACGPAVTPPPAVQDVRVPDPTPDPQYLDFLGGEQTVKPGGDVMFCTHFRYDGPDVAFDSIDMQQGKWGHHAVLLAAKNPLEPGSVEDCSNPADMAKFDVFATFGDPLPEGHAMLLPHGKTIVLQSHYLNAGPKELLVRDVLRVRTKAVADVQYWGSSFANAELTFTLPPHSTGKVVSECVSPSDMKVLLLGGHMHEWGTKFVTEVGPDRDHLSKVFSVDEWKPEFRDVPPVFLGYTNPMIWPRGSVVRTTCEWNNTTDQVLGFPEEMCATFGYADGIDVWSCNAQKI